MQNKRKWELGFFSKASPNNCCLFDPTKICNAKISFKSFQSKAVLFLDKQVMRSLHNIHHTSERRILNIFCGISQVTMVTFQRLAKNLVNFISQMLELVGTPCKNDREKLFEIKKWRFGHQKKSREGAYCLLILQKVYRYYCYQKKQVFLFGSSCCASRHFILHASSTFSGKKYRL